MGQERETLETESQCGSSTASGQWICRVVSRWGRPRVGIV